MPSTNEDYVKQLIHTVYDDDWVELYNQDRSLRYVYTLSYPGILRTVYAGSSDKGKDNRVFNDMRRLHDEVCQLLDEGWGMFS